MANHKILVVDDDKEDHLILQEYFKDAGIEENLIRFAENGRNALDYLSHLAADEELPNLIVLDLNMPIMNGTQTLLYLKQEPRYKKIPVIIFSTSENENEKRKCLSFGATDYLVKPMTLDEGHAVIRKFASYL